MNLFASFILRALAVLVKDTVFHNSYSRRPASESGWLSYLSEVTPPTGWGTAGGEGGEGEIKGATASLIDRQCVTSKRNLPGAGWGRASQGRWARHGDSSTASKAS